MNDEQSLKHWFAKLRDLRGEVEKVRNMICNKFAKDMGDNLNCATQWDEVNKNVWVKKGISKNFKQTEELKEGNKDPDYDGMTGIPRVLFGGYHLANKTLVMIWTLLPMKVTDWRFYELETNAKDIDLTA